MPTGYIYEISSNDKSINETYIGSTWNMGKRRRLHVSRCYNKKYKHYTFPVYKYIRENGDFHTFNMKIIDSGECEDLTELICGEQFYIDMAGGIENLLNCKDALEDKEKRKEKSAIRSIKIQKKNVETKKYPCELCGKCFQSNRDLQRHIAGPRHKKKLSQTDIV